jgi:hypothetical protein
MAYKSIIFCSLLPKHKSVSCISDKLVTTLSGFSIYTILDDNVRSSVLAVRSSASESVEGGIEVGTESKSKESESNAADMLESECKSEVTDREIISSISRIGMTRSSSTSS